MLERLFNLGEYGDKLSSKLSKQITKERTENSVLLGQLMGYEDDRKLISHLQEQGDKLIRLLGRER